VWSEPSGKACGARGKTLPSGKQERRFRYLISILKHEGHGDFYVKMQHLDYIFDCNLPLI
jgi:hypothetical protein